MTNFLNALTTGIKSAQDREKNFLEIMGLLSLVKDQIEAFSNNVIKIELYGKSGDYFSDDSSDIYEDKVLYACLSSRPNDIYHDLTNIRFSQFGYPCTIDVDGDEIDSMDSLSLEKNLKDLLASSSTGQKIFDLMKIAEKDEA